MSKFIEEFIKQVASQDRQLGPEQKLFKVPNLIYEEYLQCLTHYANDIMYMRGECGCFAIDANNEPIIKAIHHWLTNTSETLKLNRGILIIGGYGTGKSLLIQSFSRLYNYIRRNSITCGPATFIKSNNLMKELIAGNSSKFVKGPLFIDELGSESKTVNQYGNVNYPVSELIQELYDSGIALFGTSNLTLEQLSSDKVYGKLIGDRLIQMLNILILNTKSYRK